MKQLMVRPMGQFVILVALVSSQFVFSRDLIRPSGDPTQPTITTSESRSTFSISSDVSYSVDEITVDLVAGDIMISFNSPIGLATVSINDKNGNLVYQTTADTDFTAEVSVPVDFFKSGDYTVTVTYGSSVYTEQIQL